MHGWEGARKRDKSLATRSLLDVFPHGTCVPFTPPHAEERPQVASRSMRGTLGIRSHPSRRPLCGLLRMRAEQGCLQKMCVGSQFVTPLLRTCHGVSHE